MISIENIAAAQAAQMLDELSALLKDTVDGGAAIGFLPPLDIQAAREYWLDVIHSVQNGSRILLVALDAGRAVGTVQLELATRPNGRHRAEIQKLFVHTSARGHGIAPRLLREIETCACQAGRTTLVLDTRQGDVAEKIYTKLGYTAAGVIPQFAYSADGTLHATVLFYKLLAPDE